MAEDVQISDDGSLVDSSGKQLLTDPETRSRLVDALAATFGTPIDRAALLTKRPRTLFASDFLLDDLPEWDMSSSTGTTSLSFSNYSVRRGGRLLTITDSDNSGRRTLAARFPVPTFRPLWATVDEVTVAAGQIFTFVIQSTIGPTVNLAGFRITGHASTPGVQVWNGAAAEWVTVTSGVGTGFATSRAFRLGVAVDPVTNKANYYLYWEASSTTRHVFLGSLDLPPGRNYPGRLDLSTATSNSGDVTVARVRVEELWGVLHGPSTDAGHNWYDQSPSLYGAANDHRSNPAAQIARNIWGDEGGILNQAHGGWNFQTMLEGGSGGEATATWDNMVVALRPVFVIVGSAVNDLGLAAALSGSARTAAIAAAKGRYEDAITKSLSVAEFVVLHTVSPIGGHVSFPDDDDLAMVREWNDWVRSLAGPRVVVSDLWSVLGDPANPDALLPYYDPGDHIHYTDAGIERLGLETARAVIGRAS